MGNLRASSLEVTDEAGGRLSLPEEKAWSEKRSRWERSVGSSGRQRKASLGRTEGDWAEIRRKPGALSQNQSRGCFTCRSVGCCRAARPDED